MTFTIGLILFGGAAVLLGAWLYHVAIFGLGLWIGRDVFVGVGERGRDIVIPKVSSSVPTVSGIDVDRFLQERIGSARMDWSDDVIREDWHDNPNAHWHEYPAELVARAFVEWEDNLQTYPPPLAAEGHIHEGGSSPHPCTEVHPDGEACTWHPIGWKVGDA